MLLVVDHDAQARSVTARMLQNAGFAVLTADTAARALELLGEARADPVVLVIVDAGILGPRTADLVSTIGQRVPAGRILFLAGAGSPAWLPPGAILSKPFSQQELVRRVWELIADD